MGAQKEGRNLFMAAAMVETNIPAQSARSGRFPTSVLTSTNTELVGFAVFGLGTVRWKKRASRTCGAPTTMKVRGQWYRSIIQPPPAAPSPRPNA